MLEPLREKKRRARERISRLFERQPSPRPPSVGPSRAPQSASGPSPNAQQSHGLTTPTPADDGPGLSVQQGHGLTTAPELAFVAKPDRSAWERAYEIASNKLSDEERRWVNEVRAQSTGGNSLIKITEDARLKIKGDRSEGIAPSLMDHLERLLKRVDKYAKVVDIAIQHSPEITALVWAGLRFILHVALDHFEALESLEKAIDTIGISMADCEFYAKIYTNSSDITLDSVETTRTFRQGMDEALPEFYAAVLVFSTKARAYFLRQISDKFKHCLEPFSEGLEPFIDGIDDARGKVKKFAEMAAMRKVNEHNEILQKMRADAEDTKRAAIASLIGSLPYAANAAFDSQLWEKESQCLRGTRAELLEEIENWSEDHDGAPVFWLSGMAGTGKSTISRTVAAIMESRGRLGASFFFSRGQGDLSRAGKFFTTLAVQLARAFPELKPEIGKVIEADPKISDQGLQVQWKRLISEPLQGLRAIPGTLVIIIDALDECSDEGDVSLIINLLSQSTSDESQGPRVRMFLTSRPETYIRLQFCQLPETVHRDIALDNIPGPIIQKDILAFLHSEMERIRRAHSLPTAWPGGEAIEVLVSKAGTMFIYAATVCRFVEDRRFDPQKRLTHILNTNTGANNRRSTVDLDIMYAQVIEHSVTANHPEDAKELQERFQRIIGLIVVLNDTLSCSDIAMLVGVDKEEIERALDPLRSVLHAPDNESDRIRLCHPSFRDFLTDSSRCSSLGLYIDKEQKSSEIAHNCLELMSSKLKKDICGLRSPGPLDGSKLTSARINNCIPPAVQYACCFWIDHLNNAANGVQQDRIQDGGCVHNFLLKHSLHWIETLGIIGKLPEGLAALMALESMLPHDTCEHKEMRQFAYDMRRLLLSNILALQTAPLSIYLSALAFSPRNSTIRHKFGDGAPYWLKHIIGIENDWTPLLQTLEGHFGDVKAVSFSPDGQLIASASDDNTVRLWDASTGVLRSSLEGHSGAVRAVSFSPDGQLIASASYDKTVRLWDASTGVLRSSLEGHSSVVRAVSFSPDGQLIASASDDKTVRLWDASTGVLRSSLEGHSEWVRAVSFSPDGQLVASASDDKTVRLWDLPGALGSTSKSHSHPASGALSSTAGQPFERANETTSTPNSPDRLDVQIINTSEIIRDLAFKDNCGLHTDRGIFKLQRSAVGQQKPVITLSPQFTVMGAWVSRGVEKELWLPPAYRSSCLAIGNNTLAIGCESGRMMILEIPREDEDLS